MNTTVKVLLTIAAVAAITIAFGVSAVRAGPSFELNIGPKGCDFRIDRNDKHWQRYRRREICHRRARRYCSHWREEYKYFRDRWYLRQYKSCKKDYMWMCRNT